MTFAQIPAGAAIFLDANSLVYHFTNDPKYGVACTRLVHQVEQGVLTGFTSTDVLGDVAHRLMTLPLLSRELPEAETRSSPRVARALRRRHNPTNRRQSHFEGIGPCPRSSRRMPPA